MLELSYHWAGDYLIPDLDAPEAPRIGKYGTIRHNYLRDHHRGVFDAMLLKGTLQEKGVKLTLRAIAEEAELSHTTLLQPAIKLELYKAFPIGEKNQPIRKQKSSRTRL